MPITIILLSLTAIFLSYSLWVLVTQSLFKSRLTYKEPKKLPPFSDFEARIKAEKSYAIKRKENFSEEDAVSYLGKQTIEEIIEGSCSFKIDPKNSTTPSLGFVFMHGINEAAGKMKPLAQKIHEQYPESLMVGTTMPGHGGLPNQMLDVSYMDWVKMCSETIDWMSDRVDQIILVGFSTGGSLATHHVVNHKHDKVKGMVLFAPATHIKLQYRPSKILKRIIDFPRIIKQDNAYGYGTAAFNGIDQVVRLSDDIDKKKDIDIPVLCILSASDEAIPVNNVKNYFVNNTNSDLSSVVLFDQVPKNELNHKIECIHNQGVLNNYRCFGVAHTALVVPPDHKTLGFNKESFDKRLYHGIGFNPTNINHENIHYGPICASNAWAIFNKRFALGSFNPYFDQTYTKICQFVDNIQSNPQSSMTSATP
ncbi:MAG: alpha/beta hydrolase [Candidatus Comchoanobacterales bacterium]